MYRVVVVLMIIAEIYKGEMVAVTNQILRTIQTLEVKLQEDLRGLLSMIYKGQN